MHEILVSGDTIVFEPGPAWTWDGWNGEIAIEPENRGLTTNDSDVAFEPDLVNLGQKLAGKKYKASGFDNVPGVATVGSVTVKPTTLSNVAVSSGMKMAHSKTEGTFLISCVPSVNTSPPSPIPDPCPVKNGTWKVKKANQEVGMTT